MTYQRRRLFDSEPNVALLRATVAAVRLERPFDLLAAVVLPDHLHWIMRPPDGDADFSLRVGRIKTLFTQSLKCKADAVQGVSNRPVSMSRRKHREGDIWQRQFWEHTLHDADDLREHVDYIHYNPVKHQLVTCPHLYKASSFHAWARQRYYPTDWLCVCGATANAEPTFARVNP